MKEYRPEYKVVILIPSFISIFKEESYLAIKVYSFSTCFMDAQHHVLEVVVYPDDRFFMYRLVILNETSYCFH